MHPVSDPDVVWYGGIGHKLIGTDDDEGTGVQCYRCGMVADGSAWQELIPDCDPDGGDHHWMGEWLLGTEQLTCAYGDAFLLRDGGWETAGGRCRRA